MRRFLLLFAVFLGLGLAFAQQPEPTPTPTPVPDPDPLPGRPFADLVKLFDYPPEAPMNAWVGRPISMGPTEGSQLQFDEPIGGFPVIANVIEPRRPHAQLPAVIFAELGCWNRSLEPEFLAHLGAVTVNLQARCAPVHRDPARELLRDEADRRHPTEIARREVVALRRSYDYLVARGDVDPRRICVVGRNATAVLAGIDQRFKCFVFREGQLEPFTHPTHEPSPVELEKMGVWADDWNPYQPVHYVGQIKATSLFQAGVDVWSFFGYPLPGTTVVNDANIAKSKEEGRAFYKAAGGHKRYRWYKPWSRDENFNALDHRTQYYRSYNMPVVTDAIWFLSAQLNLSAPTPWLCLRFSWPEVCRDPNEKPVPPGAAASGTPKTASSIREP
jgi:hypothetical protein